MRRYISFLIKKNAVIVLLFSLAASVFSQPKFSSSEVNNFDRLIMNPYSKTLDYLGTENKIENGDWDDSFFSGHATLSFAAAGFTTFMFCHYFPNSPWKIPVIAASYLLATSTAGLRLASGNHFLTDVLCGAAVGSVIGFLVPYVNSLWWKPTQTDKAQFSVLSLGFSASFYF